MSVRAYRIIEIKTEENPSFNLWHDHNLRNFIDEDGELYNHLASDGTGIAEVPVRRLKRAVKMSTELNIDEKTVNQLKKDIAAAKSNKRSVLPIFASNSLRCPRVGRSPKYIYYRVHQKLFLS